MSHDPERAYVAAMLDHADAQLDRTRADMTARVDELRTTWSSGFEQQLADHQARMAEIRKSIHGDTAPTPDLAAGDRADASAPTGYPNGHSGPRQQPTQPDPYAAELAESERIRAIPMLDWAEVRKTLIRTSDGLFG